MIPRKTPKFNKDKETERQEIKEENNPLRTRLPKTEWGGDGSIPFLMIPDLDDVNLQDEMEKYLG